ncbi:uncharacterized protein LOC141536352 [Cotesia typhae]|uniref:uncharacterized protein LOC141536352 n=1 Tax=Cotesia typhae TaxID=2053667 RepID=UPI003D6906FE
MEYIDRQQTLHRFNFKATKWGKFQHKLQSYYNTIIPDDKNLTIKEIDEFIEDINKSILTTIEETVPKFKPHNNLHKYINSRIKKLQKNKSSLITELHKLQTNNPSNHRKEIIRLKELIKLTKAELRKEFGTSSATYYAKLLREINHRDASTFFPKINRYLRRKNPISIGDQILNQNDPMLIGIPAEKINRTENNTVIISDPTSKLEVIGMFLQSINSPRYLNNETRIKEIVDKEATKIKNKLNDNHNNNTTFTKFTTENRSTLPKHEDEKEYFFCNSHSLNLILRRLPNKTSSGVDGIPTIILKHLPGNIIQALVIIFNNALNAYYFPKLWKKAKVLPILKKDKDPSKATSYRPISLTPTLSKVYETVINTQINKICKENNIIPDQQFGFKHEHSTIHAINKLVSDIQRSLHYNQLVGALLIDLEKAFDSVWLNGLMYRLIKLGFPEWMTLLISDMIHDKTFIIWDGTNFTNTTFKILEGLQQGTVNSPTLFSIYFSTLLSLFDLNKDDLKAIAFADDLVVYLPGKSPLKIQDGLQKLLNKIDKFMQTWNLRINYTKCETIVFRRSTHFLTKGSRPGLNTFTLKGTNPGTDTVVNIPHKSIVKYLGVHLDDKLRLNKHINIQLNKASAALKANRSLFYCKHLTSRAKIICHQLLIRPIITYASPIWWNTSASYMEKIRVLDRKCIRTCLRVYRSCESNFKKQISNETLYNIANIPRIDNFIIKLTRDYFAKLSSIENKEIEKILETPDQQIDITNHNSACLPPQAFIYFDKEGIIQDSNNVPTIYHWGRNVTNKRINLTSDMIVNNKYDPVYSMALPERDKMDFYSLDERYWWLEDSCHRIKLKLRKLKGWSATW